MKTSIKAAIKASVFGTRRRPMRIPLGLYRRLTLALDPTYELSYFFDTYERETLPWLKSAITKARSLIDVGAGGGELVAWALRHDNIDRVVAYEPDPDRWPVFQENLRLNSRESDDRVSMMGRRFLGTNLQEDLELIGSLPTPILIKIDIDGGEAAVLEQMRGILTNRTCLILVETHSKELDAACMSMLSDAGYSVRSVAQAGWRWLLRETRMPFNQWIVAE